MLYKCTASDAWAPPDAPVSVSVGANASCLLAFFLCLLFRAESDGCSYGG
jgi:hypothetical protein